MTPFSRHREFGAAVAHAGLGICEGLSLAPQDASIYCFFEIRQGRYLAEMTAETAHDHAIADKADGHSSG
ncbi:hypothetical protein IMCC20628_03748 [Hoeflea sp. IMCC20628]|nr:hypothetical protein IMCC20628_03748 [Hoeflea sp. IMCC20628]